MENEKSLATKPVDRSAWPKLSLIGLFLFIAASGAIGKECGKATVDYAKSLRASPLESSFTLFADATAKLEPFGTGPIPQASRREIEDVIARGLEAAASVSDSELSELHPDLPRAYRDGLVAMWSHTYDALQSVDYVTERSKHSALALQASQRWSDFVRQNPNLDLSH